MIEIECLWECNDGLGESPIWLAEESSLYWADHAGPSLEMAGSRRPAIRRLNVATQQRQVWEMPEQVGSFGFRTGGGLIAGANSGFCAIDLDTAQFERIVDPEPDKAIRFLVRSFAGWHANEVEVTMSEIKIVKGYVPGSLGRVAELHGAYYHANWGFGLFFEAKVAVELAQFLKRYDENRDGFWIVSVDGRIEGSITIDGLHSESEGAHLRWFIMSDALRGKGAGNRLVDTAMGFCRSKDYRKIYLWTFEGLGSARHLYEKAGFRLVEEHKGSQWGTEVTEQRFECALPVRS